MTLQTRIILLFSLLLLIILALAWWGSRWLSQDLSRELDRVAVVVGESVITAIDEQDLNFEENDSGVVVLVERVIETDGRVIRSMQRQQGNTITELSIQVDEDEPQILEFPAGQRMTAESMLTARIKLHSAAGASAGPGVLRLIGGLEPTTIPVPKEGVTEAMQRFSTRLVVGLIALFSMGLIAAAVIVHRVSRPLRGLQQVARQVGQGDLGAQVVADTGISEVRESIDAFNRMSQQLKELQHAKDQLQAREHLSELGDIGRGLAHSLRNPLNAIGLAIEELATKSRDDQSAAKLAATARSQIQRIDGSIRAFLTLASAEKTQPETLEVCDLIQDVVLEGVQRIESPANIELKSSKSASLIGVAAEVRAMVQSLVVNSIEACSANDAAVEVYVEPLDKGVEIRVLDRGSGIDARIQPSLFQPHATTKVDGSGMGLFLTRRLAESRYSGSISLENRNGGGAVATLRLKDRVNGED